MHTPNRMRALKRTELSTNGVMARASVRRLHGSTRLRRLEVQVYVKDPIAGNFLFALVLP